MTLWKPLTHAAMPDEARASRIVAFRKGVAVLHAEFVEDVRRWQSTFCRVDGTTVALYFEDASVFATALFGAWHAGKRVVLLADTQPATLERLWPIVDACAGLLPNALAPAHQPSTECVMEPLSLTHTQVVLFTSGSTGEPEQISKEMRQLDAEVHTLQAIFADEIDRPESAHVYASVSHQHIYGLLFHVLWPLAAARPMIAERLNYPEDVVSRLAGAQHAILVSSPALLTRLPGHLDWPSTRPALRAVFSSGGPLSAEGSAQCLDLMAQSPTEIFGSSETGGIAWRRRAVTGEAWRVLPGVQWRVRDALLDVRSPHLQDGGRWWTTADQVAVDGTDASGERFIFQGRMDRIVKVAEKRVSLTALESALQGCIEVKAAKALLMPGGRSGESAARIAVVIELTAEGWKRLFADGRRAMNEYLRSFLLPKVDAVTVPRRWRYVEQLPVNAQGKTSQQNLLQLFRPVLPECKWLKREELEVCALLDVDADLLVFDGHFPQAPLVPGVAQLHWAHCIGQRCFAMPDNFLRAEALKFQQAIVPGQQVQLSLHWNPDQSVLRFSFQSDAGPHSGGRLLYEAQS